MTLSELEKSKFWALNRKHLKEKNEEWNDFNNYPFGKDTKSPDYYYTQDIFGDGQGITGRMKKRKNKNVKIRKIKKTT
jgi:hypothetical protein